MSVKDALEKYSKKQLSSDRRPTRKNKKPEQKTVNACMEFFKDFGFSMHIVESKAVYNVRAGRYLTGQTVSGFTDSAACTPNGIGCFVEFKAKGRLSTLREAQREFMMEKIIKGCFSCVVDSAERLKRIYADWTKLKNLGGDEATAYLLAEMPKKKKPFRYSGDPF